MIERSRHDELLGELHTHRRILLKIANAYCRNEADKQDLMQETVIQLWQSLAQFDGRSRFSTWIYRVALNVAISWSRNESRRSRRQVAMDDTAPEAFRIADLTEDASANLDLLNQMLGRLNELDRALMLMHLEGHEHEVISEVLGISATNVATKLSRLKLRLQNEFDSH